MNIQPQTLLGAIRYFSNPDVCQDFMVKLRWPSGTVACPTCGREDVRYISTRRLWECKDKHAKRQFSVKVGTIFEDSPIALDKWLATIWLIANAKNGVSSYEIHRSIGVTQKTAWFMLHRIRLAMQAESFDQMGGEVEADETYVGGKARNMHPGRRARLKGQSHGFAGKTAVFGLLERKGRDGHSVEPFHLFRYLDEQAFRFNSRSTVDADRFERVASAVVGKRLTYSGLIGANTTPA